jgi:hypothetical protein
MGGNGRDLEGEADDDEDDRERDDGDVAALGHGVGHAGQPGGAGDAVEQRHPVEHDGRGEHAEQEVLHPRLVALLIPLPPRRQHVGGMESTEGDEDAHQVAGRGHHHHAEHRAEQQEVVLALVVVALLDVGGREQDDDVTGQKEERLQDQREVVDDVATVEHGTVVAVDGQRQDRHQGGQQPQTGDGRRRPLLPFRQEEVGDQQHDDRAGEDDLGRERVVVDRR